MDALLFKRIIVVGCSGSGKSTLACTLADRLGLPYVPTDHVYWTNDWKPTPEGEVRTWAEATSLAESWVFDGNFDVNRDIVWQRAELAVWLDLPLATTIGRVICRNFLWWGKREKIWGGKRMTFLKACSGVRHVLRSHFTKRRVYPILLAEFPHLIKIRITSTAQLEHWLESIKRTS